MLHVLVADDNEGDRLLLRSMLERYGHQTYPAASGEEALRLYLRHPIDVVVTDLQMPHGDGFELISALKGLDPDVSVVAVSGEPQHKLQVAQLAGARIILHKPLSPESLLAAVREASGPKSDSIAL